MVNLGDNLMPHHVTKVISSGQTGIDRRGLEVARALGILTGGTAPKSYLTENGPDDSLRDFGLTEHTSSKYPARTKANVIQSDGTVLFGNVTTGGTKLTLYICIREGQPCIASPTDEELSQWLIDNRINVLNVAGNRGRQLSEGQLEGYRQVLIEALV